jgi:2'-5' RNA ligase
MSDQPAASVAPARRGGLIVPVPEAEAVVQGWRAKFAPDAALGVPAHVTLLFPFHTLTQLDPAALADLRSLFGRTASIEATFSSVGRFPEVVYLAPEPADWFVTLTETLSARFGLLPYGGIHQQIVPHLTVAQHPDQVILSEVARALPPLLPITTVVREVWLMEETAAGRWERTATFALGT